jgi:hypothetical protein
VVTAAVPPARPFATARGPQRRGATSSTLSTGAFTVRGQSTAYGCRVSGALENRAAVFTSQPQAVEVYQAGAWWSGELLGWRHDADGSCQVWVRVVLGGIEESAWTDLASLRLPERHLSMAPASPARSPYAPATQEMSVSRHPAGRRAAATDGDPSTTASLPLVRDFTVVPNGAPAASAGGRRRAPEEVATPSGGRRRAPEAAPAVPASGGRRRAPETTAASAVAAHPAVPAPPLGRHRASGADAGRHRTADTGLLPPVADGAPAPGSGARRPAPQATATHAVPPPSAQGARPQESARSRGRDSWTAPEGLEPELLTRPMRLSDLTPHAGRPRVDGSRPRV